MKRGVPMRLLFIHHSCGGQLLAASGPENGDGHCLYDSHPNGGGLRALLEAFGYEVHEASYGSDVGEATDLFDWLPKFQTRMDKVLRVDRNDEVYPDARKNQIVVFKSCFPNSDLIGLGTPPGDPRGPELTVWNAKATLTALLAELKRRPEVLFVYVTAPPLAPKVGRAPAWRALARKVTGKPDREERLHAHAALARELNDWITSTEGWLADYPQKNVVVFDYYDLLTSSGASNLSRFATGNGHDSHPSGEGNQKAATAFVPFLDRAVQRAGMMP